MLLRDISIKSPISRASLQSTRRLLKSIRNQEMIQKHIHSTENLYSPEIKRSLFNNRSGSVLQYEKDRISASPSYHEDLNKFYGLETPSGRNDIRHNKSNILIRENSVSSRKSPYRQR